MIKVKFFQGNSTNYDKLEQDINDWISANNGSIYIIDIQFQKDTGDREAMVMYEDHSNEKLSCEAMNVYHTPIDDKGNVNDIHRFFEEDLEMNEFMSEYPTIGGKKNG